MDNYPPGAAHDPLAPYNEEPCPDIDVTVRATLVKATVLSGRYESRIADYFSNQQKSPIELIRVLEEIVRQLMSDGHRSYAHRYLPCLLDDCEGWEEENLKFEL